MSEKDLPKDKYFHVLFLPTGTGKTTIFTRKLAETLDCGEGLTLLEPTVAASRCAYDNFVTYVKNHKLEKTYTVRLRIGSRNEESELNYGGGAINIYVYTAGKFRVDYRRLVKDCKYILVDEAHVRSDPTIVWDKSIIGRNVGENYRVCYLTATNIEFEKWGHPLGDQNKLLTDRHPILENLLSWHRIAKRSPEC